MDLMIESLPRLLNATKLTIELTLLSLFFGIFVGVFFAILRTSKILNHQAKTIEFKESGNTKISSLEIFLCFMIFIFSFSAIISRNFIEIKQPDNAKTIISQSINWIADIQKVSFVIIEQNANPQNADKQSLDNLLPFKNIEINEK